MMKKKRLAISAILVTALALLMVGPAAADVSPPQVNVTLAPGQSVDIDKEVTTPEIPPNPDIVFLADTTGSMGAAIANVQANAASILGTVLAAQSTAQFAVAEYRDTGDAFTWRVNQNLTASQAAAAAAIGGWSAGGGGDLPEAQLIALAGIPGAISFRANSTRVVVWFGDNPGHEGGPYPLRASVITALIGANVSVIAIGVNTGGAGLDSTGQATAIATGTSGQFFPGASPAQVSAAILSGLSSLPITVTPVAVGCDPLNVSFVPASQTVTSGNDVNFVETIAVPSDPTLAGTQIVCTVEFRDEHGNVIGTQNVTVSVPIELDAEPDVATNELGTPGQTHTVTATVTSGAVAIPDRTVEFEVVSGPNVGIVGSGATDVDGQASFTYDARQGLAGVGTDIIEACLADTDVCDAVRKEWMDTTPPEVDCAETVNPHGNKVPPAGSTTLPGPKGGQNEDGFYELAATDSVDPNPQIFVVDTGSGAVFGPFSVGDKIKYTEAPGATPGSKKIGSTNPSNNGKSDAIEVHITGTGDMEVFAVDASGNISAAAACLVPPPPK